MTTENVAPHSPLRILLADDDVMSQKLVLAILQHQGYQIDIVNDGLAVLEALEQRAYDVILMDLQMPKLDGLETTRRIRQEFATQDQPRIIAMTGHTRQGDREWCLSMGLDDYIGKPVNISELMRVLTKSQQLPTADDKPASKTPKNAEAIQSAETVIDLAVINKLKNSLPKNAEQMLPQLISRFQTSAYDLISEARQAFNLGQADDLSRVAHTLKSTSATLGATTLTNLAQELEDVTENGLSPEVAHLIEQAELEWTKVKAALAEIYPQL